jgi:hypothetical protein
MLSTPAGQPDPLAHPDGVPLAGTFLLDPRDRDDQLPGSSNRMRYTLTLRLFKVPVSDKVFNFSDSMEQVPFWQDWLIVDVDPMPATGDGKPAAYAAWGSVIPGPILDPDPLNQELPPEQGGQTLEFTAGAGSLQALVPLPAAAAQGQILGGQAKIRITVRGR